MNAIEVARKVVAEQQAHLFRLRAPVAPYEYDAKPYGGGRAGKSWVILDGFSANAICKVYDALSPENQAKYLSKDLIAMANIAFKMLK